MQAFRLLLGIIMWLPAVPAAQQERTADDDLLARAQAIHDRVLVLDSHVDINPSTFTAERYTEELEIQVDLPKMERGGVDAAFFVRRGYTEDEIAKLWGLNLLRVMDEAQRIGRELRKE